MSVRRNAIIENIWFVDSEEKYELVIPSVTAPISYLNELKEKPKVKVPKMVDDREEWFDNVKQILTSNFTSDMSVDLPIVYICWMAERIIGTLDEDWKSYEVVIGYKGETINPLSLITLVKIQKEFSALKITNPINSGDFGILAKCLMPYRLANTPPDQSQYRTSITQRLGLLYKLEPFNLDNTIGVTNVLHWATSPSYKALCACIDMFLYKFGDHELGALRACVLTSFSKDCVVMSSLREASECLNLTPGQTVTYTFHPKIAQEVKHLTGGARTEERGVSHSYWEYMREMSLIPRSPYSATYNPNLFVWCQFVGVLKTRKRSMYARLLDVDDPPLLLTLATYVVYYLNETPTLEQTMYIAQDAWSEARKDYLDAQREGEGHRMTPEGILQKLSEHHYRITPEMKEDLQAVIQSIDGSRAGTIGEFAKKFLS